MTLLDAPQFDEVRDRRNRKILFGSVGLLFVLFIAWWLIAGRPVDWPWRWNNHLLGRVTVNRFFDAVEKNDMPAAYGIWIHDKNWQQHQAAFAANPYDKFLATHGYAGKPNSLDKDTAKKMAEEYTKAMDDKDWQRQQDRLTEYPFDRFQQDWSPNSSANDYGNIQSHRIAASSMRGNVLLVGIFVNGRKSKAINLDYDPRDKTLTFSPEDVRFLEGPGGIS